MAKTAWGIEAGTSSVKAVKLSVDGRGAITLEDVSMISLANYRSSGATDQGALLGALREFVIDKGIRPSDVCYISLPGRNAFSRVVSLPPVSDDKIRETIANEARGQIPIKLEEAVWDYQRITSDSGDVEVNLYAVKRDVVDTLMRVCSQAGLTIRGIQLAPLGIYNFVKHELDASISNGCVCIDIGTENTDLVVVDGEKAWLRVVPTAGNDVTKALIMRDQRLNPQTAEALKRNPAAVVKKLNADKKDPKWPDVASVMEAMKTPLRELVADIHRSVGFYKNQNPEAQTEHLVMMGNGSRLINLDKFLRQQLQFDVTPVASLSSIIVGRGLDPAQIADRVPSLVVPIGLALQAVGVAGVSKTNLVPEDLIVQEQLSRTRPMAVLGGAIVALCGLAAFLLGMPDKGTADATLSDLKNTKSELTNIQKAWDAELARDGDLMAISTTLNNVERGENLVLITNEVYRGLVTHFETEKGVTLYRAAGTGNNDRVRGIEVKEVSAKFERSASGGSAPQAGNRNAPPPSGAVAYERRTNVEGIGSFAIELSPALPGAPADLTGQKAVAEKLSQEFLDTCAAILTTALRGDLDNTQARAGLVEKKLSPTLIEALMKLRGQTSLVVAANGRSVEELVNEKVLNTKTTGNTTRSYADVFEVPANFGTIAAGMRLSEFYHFEVKMNIAGSPWKSEAPAAAPKS